MPRPTQVRVKKNLDHWKWLLILGLVPGPWAGLAGCGASDAKGCPGGSPDCGPRLATDGSTLMTADGGAGSMPPSPDGGDSDPLWASPSGPPEMDLGTSYERSPDPGVAGGGPWLCWDQNDNDRNGLTDCDDLACGSLASCRVGSGDFCAPLPRDTLDFSTCADGDRVDTCLGRDVEELGTLRWIEGGGFHPGGDFQGDGGFALRGTDDLRTTRHQVTVRFGDTLCTGPCVESAAVGFTTQRSFATETHVRPLVGLQLSSFRHEVTLLVGGEPRASWSLPAGDGPATFTMIVRPTGRVTAGPKDDTDAQVDEAFAPARDARLVVYGRNANRSFGMGGGARIERVDLTEHQCDIPDHWTSRGPVTVLRTNRSAYDMASAGGITVATGTRGGAPHLEFAFEDGGHIFFGGQSGGPELILAHTEGSPALTGEAGGWRAQVRDPELFHDSSGATVLFFTAEDEDGALSIGRAVQRSDSHVFETVQQVLRPRDDPDARGFEMPTVAAVPGGRWVMVVRAELAGGAGARALLAYISSDEGKVWTRFRSHLLLEETLRLPDSDGTRFDAHEIAQPSLVVRDGAYRLYYAGRRGTRWSVGLTVSDELVHWRLVPDPGAVLGRGAPDAFDRLGPVEADVLVAAGEARMFYLGTDGATRGLGLAARPMPAPGAAR